MRTLLHVPGGDYETIGPLIHKHRRGLTTVAMDLYSVFTTGYLFISEDPIATPGGSAETEIPGHQKTWWKWSNAKRFLSDGQEPMPILTAVRHE